MNYLILLTASIFCLARVQSHSAKISSQINKITKLENLNFDCQLLILGRLTTADLISLAFTSKYFCHLAEYDLRRRFASKTVVFFLRLPFNENVTIKETRESIWIKIGTTATNVLKNFSHLIRSLKIDHVPSFKGGNSSGDVLPPFCQLIQTKCAESLVQLHLKNVAQSFFQNITVHFTKLQTFQWESDILELGDKQLDFGVIFPACKNLYLHHVLVLNTGQISMNFAHLEHLSAIIHKLKETDFSPDSSIIKIIRKNSKIRSLTLRDARPNLLKVVADLCSMLENLELLNYNERDSHSTEMHLNLTRLKVANCFGQNIPAHINFGVNLKEFEMQLTNPRDSKYMDLIESNGNLKVFRMLDPYGLRNADILRLAAAKLNLSELAIICKWDVKAENIVELMQSCRQLKRAHLRNEADQPNILQSIRLLHEHLDAEWHINVIGNNVFLERKGMDDHNN